MRSQSSQTTTGGLKTHIFLHYSSGPGFSVHTAPNPLHSEMRLSIITRLERLCQRFNLWTAESMRLCLWFSSATEFACCTLGVEVAVGAGQASMQVSHTAPASCLCGAQMTFPTLPPVGLVFLRQANGSSC